MTPMPDTYDAIRNGEFLTLEEQIEELQKYIPEWDGTLQDLANFCYARGWEMKLGFDQFTGAGSRCDIVDWESKDWVCDDYMGERNCWPPTIATGKWSPGNWLYAAIRAVRRALNVPEYEQ